MRSWIFSIITSVSHDPSEIFLICWFAAQETFMITINVETVVLLRISVETMIFFSKKQTNKKKVFTSNMFS